MKRMMAMMCVATACSAAAAMAQSGAPMDQDKMMKHDKMMKGTVMVTGCVADKDSMGHYMLNHAMMSGMMKPESTAGSTAPMMSYMLSGGDLKAHVGHKVEVTGMMEKAKAGTMDHKDGTMKDHKTMADHKMDGKMMDDKKMTDTLKVKSVKMLAASCM